MEKTIFALFIYVFEMLISFAFFIKNFNLKQKTRFHTIFIGLLLFLPCALLFAKFENEIINLTLFFIINFLFAFLCFDINIKAAIIQSVLLDAIMFASEILTISILSAIRELPTDIYKTNFTSFVLATIISKILYFIITQFFSLFIRKSSLQSFNNGYFVPLFIFPVLTLVTSALFLFITFDVRLSAGYQITIFVVNLLLVFYCIFVFIYFQSLSEKERKITELEAERKMNDMNDTYLEILEHQNDEFQIVFHDMKNHYLTLSQMENIGDVKQYINELYPSLENQNKVRISKNKIIDLILNKYIVVCKNRNIKFYYEVRTADLNYINDIELSVILNNALDNAVEAAENSVDKIIEFSIRHINNMDFVSIINSCDEKPVSRGSILKTTKNHMQKHGFGSKIIERYTKANKGEYEWFYDETEKRFHLSLMFQSK